MARTTMHRTNEKPQGFRVVDLPEYDVRVDGKIVGKVYARLHRESRHYSSGSVRYWHFSQAYDYRISMAFVSKQAARDALVREVGL